MSFVIEIKSFQLKDLHSMMTLCDNNLSEPYSIYTYRLFLSNYDGICYFAYINDVFCGVVLGRIKQSKKLHTHYTSILTALEQLSIANAPSNSGYIGMIVVDPKFRNLGIGTKLFDRIMEDFKAANCVKVTLETETSNVSALRFYENYGFIRVKKFEKYYLNGSSAFKLCLLMK